MFQFYRKIQNELRKFFHKATWDGRESGIRDEPLQSFNWQRHQAKAGHLEGILAVSHGTGPYKSANGLLFIDNNDYQESAKLLREFRMEGSTVFLGAANPTEAYRCTEETHYWNDRLIWQIAAFKDHILKFALDNNYSHVFLVDSDLVLHPLTLKQLLSSGKDIISEIFWTEWAPGTGELPQVWITGQYSFHLGGNSMPEEEKQRQAAQVIAQLKVPGIYEVGGLGACTLISAKAIAKGISYRRISNVDYWGEDRHFCIRAAVLGFGLYVDTHYPAFHIYRESLLPKVAEYKRSIKLAKKRGGRTGK